jgi:hypothetical protein
MVTEHAAIRASVDARICQSAHDRGGAWQLRQTLLMESVFCRREKPGDAGEWQEEMRGEER